MNELPEEHETKKTLWIYEEEINLFSTYSQIPQVIHKEQSQEQSQEFKKEQSQEFKQEQSQEFKQEQSQEFKQEQSQEFKGKLKGEEIKDIMKYKPMELIIKYTLSTENMRNEIYSKLISFISAPEFSKAFGVKKSGEIISALSNNRWNQSMALFISFLLDANVIYKDKSYLFNKNKNNIEISVM